MWSSAWDNSDLALKPGMTAATRIIVDQRNDVVRMPNQALRYAPGGLAGITSSQPGRPTNGSGEAARLWLLRDGQPVPVSVTLGLDDDNFTEIVKGDLIPETSSFSPRNGTRRVANRGCRRRASKELAKRRISRHGRVHPQGREC